jgi:response regulator RpfG family c-di-GMP phosphodiesterase
MESLPSERKRLLFIDDEAINLLGAACLFRRDFEVFTAQSGKEGLKILQSTMVDAVIADQRMPEMKGTELFALLADRDRTGLRLILTGYADDQEIYDAVSAGYVDGVLEKPLNLRELNSHLSKLDLRTA